MKLEPMMMIQEFTRIYHSYSTTQISGKSVKASDEKILYTNPLSFTCETFKYGNKNQTYGGMYGKSSQER